MMLRIIFIAFLLCTSLACKQNINQSAPPKGFATVNDTCFIQFQNKSNEKKIANYETVVIEKTICNEFEIEIPFSEKLKKTDTILVNKVDKHNFLYSILDKLHMGDTAIFCVPWQGLFATENLKPTIKLAASQKVYIHLVVKQSTSNATETSLNNVANTIADTPKVATKNAANKNAAEATIKQQKVFVPMSGDEFEKEEFTLRYFLEYTKPYMLKHEIQPGFFLLLTQKGSGDFAQMGDVVTIDYVGRFAMDGKKFDDSSFNPDPFEFELGKPDQILKGLEKALYRMRLGSRAEVYFSSRYGYGAQGSSTGIVGKYKSLTFAVHLKKINKKHNELN